MFNGGKNMKKYITEDMTKCHKLCLELLQANHVLIAGTTGSGKSVMMNSMIYTAMRTPVEWFYFIDLKRVEFSTYKILYNTFYVCTSPATVNAVLDDAIERMEERYKKMGDSRLYSGDPIYIFIDELADLVSIKGVLDRLVKIARLGRAAKVHLICATQDPSRRTLPAQLMQNLNTTVALRCRSSIESRQIIGIPGAEHLPQYGKGIMWDYRGTREVDIPMTPQKDIDNMCKGMTKKSNIINAITRGLLKMNRAPYGVDPEYWDRLEKGLAQW